MTKNSLGLTPAQLSAAIQKESEKVKEFYLWLEKAMPIAFFEEVNQEHVMLVVHTLIGFELQQYFSTIHLKNSSIVLCLDSADADLRVLKNYEMYGIKNYQAYVSQIPLPFAGTSENLRIVNIHFTHSPEPDGEPFLAEDKERLRTLLKERNPDINDEEFESILAEMNIRFLHSLPEDKIVLALDMYYRARDRDSCQYEGCYNEAWETNGAPSLQIVFAWRNTPKYNFLYRLVRVIHRHGLVLKGVSATYIKPYSKESVLVMTLGLHGINGKAVWDATDIADFLRELVTVKYFASFDEIDQHLVSKVEHISGTMGHLLRAMSNFIHQILVLVDVNLYSLDNVIEGLCRHPELTAKLCVAFGYKFDPVKNNLAEYEKIRQSLLKEVEDIDTGHIENDIRRKNVFRQGMNFIHYTLKTNFYRTNYTALGFRMDPKYLDFMSVDRVKFFPELPFAIFYIKGMHFFGYHIRFKDLARGGLRTVLTDQKERMLIERNTVFTECYNLAYTQNMKNKDIPEGGAKGIIFLKPHDHLESEAAILKRELQETKLSSEEQVHKLETFRKEQAAEYLYLSQRSFINCLMTLVNCEPDGTLRAQHIIDYWKKPEYLYLGPDENMHDVMIHWIADYSKKIQYKPGTSFISGKPTVGINHKEYGVTSLGLNIYMEQTLKYVGIDPNNQIFTVKMSGGPDGDVAGNQIYNFYKYYPKTANLIALTDGTGCIYDPEGLDLSVLVALFKEVKGIRHYPVDRLSKEGFLIDKYAKNSQTLHTPHVLCWRYVKGVMQEVWLPGNEAQYLLRSFLHSVKADVFIPAGGRPRTLNENNYKDFLDQTEKPTSRIIIEGANLYLTPGGRKELEDRGVLIIQDSSANKTGVVCSSFEVLCGLTLGDEKFLENKSVLVEQIIEKLKECALLEANLLLKVHRETGRQLTIISSEISKKINMFFDEILAFFDGIVLSDDPQDPLIRTFLDYCPALLREKYQKELLCEIPEGHKKAIIACHIASKIIYRKGLAWAPSIPDMLPMLLHNL